MIDRHEYHCEALKGAGLNCNCLYGVTVDDQYIRDKIKALRKEIGHWETKLQVLTRLKNRL